MLILVVMYTGLPLFTDPKLFEPPVIIEVEIVDVAEITNLPKPAPEPEKKEQEGSEMDFEEAEKEEPKLEGNKVFILEKSTRAELVFILKIEGSNEEHIVEVDPEKGFIGLPLEFQHSMRQFKIEDILENPQAVLEGVL